MLRKLPVAGGEETASCTTEWMVRGNLFGCECTARTHVLGLTIKAIR